MRQYRLSWLLVFVGLSLNIASAEQPAKTALLRVGQRVLVALSTQNIKALAREVSPSDGVRFTPQTYIWPSDQHFSPKQLRQAAKRQTIYNWNIDGQGDFEPPLRFDVQQYLKKIVYNRDYLKAPNVSYNKRRMSSSVIDNSATFYRGAKMIEYSFPSRPKTIDWSALRLFFRYQQGRWYLVGVINDAWST